MKKIATLTVSLVAVLSVTAGARANTPPTGIASGEWVNKYFVDFTEHDWPTMTSDNNATELVTYVKGNTATGAVDRKKVTIGSNLSVDNGVLNATDTTYTAGDNTVTIDASNHTITGNYQAGTNVQINGNVISATDTNTTYTAGDALELDGTEFNVLPDNSTIKINGQNQLYVDLANVQSDPYHADEVTVHLDPTSRTFSGMYTGGTNVTITGNTIAATDTKYQAGHATNVTDNGPVDVKHDASKAIKYDSTGDQIYVGVDTTTITYDSNGNLTTTFTDTDTNTEMVCPAGYVRTKNNRCDRILIAGDTQVDTSQDPAAITTTETANGALTVTMSATDAPTVATATYAPTNVGGTGW